MSRPKNGKPPGPPEQFTNPSALANTTPANNRADDIVLGFLSKEVDKLGTAEANSRERMGALSTHIVNLQAEIVKISAELVETKKDLGKLEHHRTAIWTGVVVIVAVVGLLWTFYGQPIGRLIKFASNETKIDNVDKLVDDQQRAEALIELADRQSKTAANKPD